MLWEETTWIIQARHKESKHSQLALRVNHISEMCYPLHHHAVLLRTRINRSLSFPRNYICTTFFLLQNSPTGGCFASHTSFFLLRCIPYVINQDHNYNILYHSQKKITPASISFTNIQLNRTHALKKKIKTWNNNQNLNAVLRDPITIIWVFSPFLHCTTFKHFATMSSNVCLCILCLPVLYIFILFVYTPLVCYLFLLSYN